MSKQKFDMLAMKSKIYNTTFYKSNSPVGAVQVEANLQEQLSNHLQFRKVNIAKRQVLKVILHVCAICHCFDILKFQNFYIEKAGKGPVEQFL